MVAINQKVAEITVAYNSKQKALEQPKLSATVDAFLFLLDGYNMDTIGLQEQFVVMYLNVSSRVMGIYRASNGGITGTVCDTRIILSVALRIAATGIILSHNHPSGNLKPSQADVDMTRKLKEAARFMDIKLVDHIIVDPSGTRYFSFADEGML
jgi:DNA repair protein RadC